MLAFKPVTIQDKSRLEAYLRRTDSYFCDFCFTDIFLWKDFYETFYCIEDDTLFLFYKSFQDKKPCYVMPSGFSKLEKAISMIKEDAKERQIQPIITCLTSEQAKEIEKAYPNVFIVEELRDSADYLYNSTDLINLKGNKYHKKKNLINRFKKTFDNDWRYENMTSKHIDEIWSFYEVWFQKNGEVEESSFLNGEKHAIRIALNHFNELDLQGGLLRLKEQIIAFSIGSKSTEDMFIILIEKADSNVTGAYQMINQQFARANCYNVKWINREEDLGITGLRKAKLSYHPSFIAMKYRAQLMDDGVV